jgi:multimeric flavodoxin WrbA
MQIMTILGSPRRAGNTARVLAWVEERFRSAGHDVSRVDIIDRHVDGCTECMACKKGKIELCSLRDDGNDLFRQMAAADLVLLAAPVFCWGFPAQIKGLIDRMFCLMDFEGRRTDVPRLYDKPLAVLLTAGGERTDNADLVFRGFQHGANLLFARLVDELLIPNCSAGGVPEESEKQAVAFADHLIATVAP